MNARHLFFTLFRFNLRLLPRNIWTLLPIVALSSLMMPILELSLRGGPGRWEDSGLSSSLIPFPIMFCSLLVIQFFIGDTGWTGTAPVWLMPASEFLLVRPVPRRIAYLSRIALYFIVMVSVPLLRIGLTLPQPDLYLSLYQSKTYQTEASTKVNLYRDQFPDSSVIHVPKSGHDTLLIPWGAARIAFWQLWLVILLALAVQAATLLILPPKVQIGVLMTLCMGPMVFIAFAASSEQNAAQENAFFFFSHHSILIALLTLGVFVLVQRMALKRVDALEVI